MWSIEMRQVPCNSPYDTVSAEHIRQTNESNGEIVASTDAIDGQSARDNGNQRSAMGVRKRYSIDSLEEVKTFMNLIGISRII